MRRKDELEIVYKKIEELLIKEPELKVVRIAERFGVTMMTIRNIRKRMLAKHARKNNKS